MSYEINIVSIGQKVSHNLQFDTEIEVINEVEDETVGRYQISWPFISSSDGIWYSIGITEDGWFNTMSIIDIDFDETPENRYIPYWVKDEKVLDNIHSIILNSRYEDEIELILKTLLQKSPMKTILFLCRYQGGEEELVNGVIKFNEFIRMLKDGNICSNICYIVKD